jgi:hypothetical protein
MAKLFFRGNAELLYVSLHYLMFGLAEAMERLGHEIIADSDTRQRAL